MDNLNYPDSECLLQSSLPQHISIRGSEGPLLRDVAMTSPRNTPHLLNMSSLAWNNLRFNVEVLGCAE